MKPFHGIIDSSLECQSKPLQIPIMQLTIFIHSLIAVDSDK